MKKEQQDLAWSVLTKEERESKRNFYYAPTNNEFSRGYKKAYNDIFGHHNLTSDTEPEEMLMISRKEVHKLHDDFIRDEWYERAACLDELFGDKCLPDKELNEDNFAKSEPSVQDASKPKFNEGQLVMYSGQIYEIEYKTGKYHYALKGIGYDVHENYLEPYTEPETKDNMEEKELNLCELLKGCEGEEFYSPTFGDVRLDIIDKDYIGVVSDEDPASYKIFANGTYTKNGKICLYPSRALYEKYPLDAYSAWMEWQESRKSKRYRAEEGKEYWYLSAYVAPELTSDDLLNSDDKLYECGNYFRTKKEAQQAAEAVRETLMKFHELNQKQ